MRRPVIIAALAALFLLAVQVILPGVSAKEIPMWQGVSKTAAQIEADRKLVEAAVKLANGNADRAAQRAVALGWKEIHKGDTEQALRRFNQAWLINPKRGDIYWGFAVATGIRGDDLGTVDKWFRKAEAIVGPHWRLHSDWGRILEQRNESEAAIPHFQRSIKVNPKNPEPHIGLIRAFKRLGNEAMAKKHMEIYNQMAN